MSIVDSSNPCKVVWAPGEVSLNDLAIFTSYMAEIESELAWPFATERSGTAPGSFRVSYIMLASPLILNVVSHAGEGVTALGVLSYILKHPEEIGGWIGKFRTSMSNNQKDALIAKAEYLRTKSEIEVSGEPLIRFEREYQPHVRRRLAERQPDFEAGS
jgi:hypothetical protein